MPSTQLLRSPAVCCPVCSLTPLHESGVLTGISTVIAFDYPPTADPAAYYQDRAKLVAVAANLRRLNLPGWAVPAEDCVNLDGWLVAAALALDLPQ